jgi:hypothetical protein
VDLVELSGEHERRRGHQLVVVIHTDVADALKK